MALARLMIYTAMEEAGRGFSICFVSHNGYTAIGGNGRGFVGGVESQTSMLARRLARDGFVVSFLTWDEGGPAEEMIDGVRVIKICRQHAGLPGIRFFYPKWTGLDAALKRADADVYYHNCGECVTGQIAWWCKRNRRRFVFALASNADCDRRLPEMRGSHEKMLYRYGLRNAKAVIAQSEAQRRMLLDSWGVGSSVVPMPCAPPGEDEGVGPFRETGRVLWVGRVCPVKRLAWLLEIAASLPGVGFDLVGPFDGGAYGNRIKAMARKLSNVVIHGSIPKAEVGRFYRGASVLCSTSEYEGFPNTFLEAWSRGLPVVSTFDPDGLIAREELGIHAADVDGIRAGIGTLLTDGGKYLNCSRNGMSYFETHHSLERVIPRIVDILKTRSVPADSGGASSGAK